MEIEIAAGDLDRARSAADELELVADRFAGKPLVASAALARGRVRLAGGDAAGAEQSLSEAVRLWNEVGAPYEAARARTSDGKAMKYYQAAPFTLQLTPQSVRQAVQTLTATEERPQ